MRSSMFKISVMLVVVASLTACQFIDSEQTSIQKSAPPNFTDQPQELCDGSNDIRLSYVLSGGGQSTAGQTLYAGQGSSYLHINGKCEYWAYQPDNTITSSGHVPVMHGTLAAQQAEDLTQHLMLQDWKDVEVDQTPKSGVSHPSVASFTFAGEGFSCGCNDSQSSTISARMYQELNALYQVGEPLDGPVKVLVVDASESIDTATYPTESWTLSAPITDYAVTYELASSQSSHKVVTGADADILRSMRDRLSAGDYTQRIGFIPIKSTDGTQLFEVYISDMLPFSP